MPRRAATLHVLTERLGDIGSIDAPAKRLGKAIRGAVGPGPLREGLSGAWLGHALHPLLTDTVIGTWTSALLLDVVGGEDDDGAAQMLIGAGILAYGPTAATGALDWADTEAGDDGVRRIGIVHAATNAAALALQTASLVARRRGDRGRGVALSLGAMSLLGAGGYLGAHLSYARGVGVDQTSFDPGPADWTPVIEAAALGERAPVSAVAGETPVLLVRDGEAIHAIHDRCSHRGCSLAAGRLDGDVVECTCHGSRFRLADGGIERGPAASPQPAFETREREGRVEVRLRAPH